MYEAVDALVGTNVIKLVVNVLPLPLVKVILGLENEAVVNKEPVSVEPPPPPPFKANDAVTAKSAFFAFIAYCTGFCGL
jgi:hypothetical protein